MSERYNRQVLWSMNKVPTLARLIYDAQSEAISEAAEVLDVEAEIILAIAVGELEFDSEFFW